MVHTPSVAAPILLPSDAAQMQCKSDMIIGIQRQGRNIFEDSPLAGKWLTVAWMIANDRTALAPTNRKGIGVTQKPLVHASSHP